MYLQSSFPVLWYQAYNPHLLTSPLQCSPARTGPFQNHFFTLSEPFFKLLKSSISGRSHTAEQFIKKQTVNKV